MIKKEYIELKKQLLKENPDNIFMILTEVVEPEDLLIEKLIKENSSEKDYKLLEKLIENEILEQYNLLIEFYNVLDDDNKNNKEVGLLFIRKCNEKYLINLYEIFSEKLQKNKDIISVILSKLSIYKIFYFYNKLHIEMKKDSMVISFFINTLKESKEINPLDMIEFYNNLNKDLKKDDFTIFQILDYLNNLKEAAITEEYLLNLYDLFYKEIGKNIENGNINIFKFLKIKKSNFKKALLDSDSIVNFHYSKENLPIRNFYIFYKNLSKTQQEADFIIMTLFDLIESHSEKDFPSILNIENLKKNISENILNLDNIKIVLDENENENENENEDDDDEYKKELDEEMIQETLNLYKNLKCPNNDNSKYINYIINIDEEILKKNLDKKDFEKIIRIKRSSYLIDNTKAEDLFNLFLDLDDFSKNSDIIISSIFNKIDNENLLKLFEEMLKSNNEAFNITYIRQKVKRDNVLELIDILLKYKKEYMGYLSFFMLIHYDKIDEEDLFYVYEKLPEEIQKNHNLLNKILEKCNYETFEKISKNLDNKDLEELKKVKKYKQSFEDILNSRKK